MGSSNRTADTPTARGRSPRRRSPPESFAQAQQAAIELDQREQLARAVVDFFPGGAGAGAKGADVLETRQGRQQVEELKDEADLVPARSRQVIV